ncbi:MAG: hypothetical protein AAF491_12025, partial [Verrucomicrobiota bacterium]
MRNPTTHPFFIFLFAVVCGAPSIVRSQETKEEFATREAKLLYDVERAEARKPLRELHEKLDAALQKLERGWQDEGDLEALLVLQTERASFRDRTEPAEASSLRELESLRRIYWREYKTLQPEIEKSDGEALARFVGTLETIIRGLTQENRIEEALEVRKEIDRAIAESEGQTGTIAMSSNEEVVLGEEENYVIDTDCELTKKGSRYVITSDAFDGTYVASKRSFQTPFRIVTRAETDTNNLRLYFGKHGKIVLNWSTKPSELRIVEPNDMRRNGIPDRGYIEPGLLHDIEVSVTASAIRLRVDGEERARIEG